MVKRTAVYQHVVTEGTHYEVGRQLGAIIREKESLVRFMSSPFMNGPALQASAVHHAMDRIEQINPGLNEEIRGFADELQLKAEQVVFYYSYIQPQGHCSQAALHIKDPAGAQTYHMRTYDYGWEDEPYNQLLLTTTRVTGKPRHIGFALQLFGRYDGMNDEGLSVTTTSGRMRPEMTEEGFVFPAVVRALLDQCSSTKEAAALIRSIPICDYRNYLISDRHGKIALIEAAGSHMEVEMIRPSAANEHVKLAVSTNHYTLPAMLQHNREVMYNSKARLDALHAAFAFLDTSPDTADAAALLKQLAGRTAPDGVCCHHYSEGFGTMWSMLFDNVERTSQICFGSPALNDWRTFGFSEPAGENTYTAILPDEPSQGLFWSHA
ncbi:C45 family autoproteolytic acyltransferase/hydolase [Paenibacillus tepidiphilus]|uniref:C45 family autoproteolytic acyltransferase/hydolase n=1 Tax=Paenibacillus tepidiphilus TaxID=2608683 RepID=UPI0013A55641|nr:C45 family peptidase [Paenibacillus tepidiphilus]